MTGIDVFLVCYVFNVMGVQEAVTADSFGSSTLILWQPGEFEWLGDVAVRDPTVATSNRACTASAQGRRVLYKLQACGDTTPNMGGLTPSCQHSGIYSGQSQPSLHPLRQSRAVPGILQMNRNDP